MTYLKGTAAAALTLSCLLAAGTGPAAAYTLMDMLRGNVRNGKLIERGSVTDVQTLPQGGPQNARNADPEPAPKIAGPRYYTYKPDAVRRIAFGSAAAGVPDHELTTGSIAPGADPRAFLSDVSVLAPATVAAAVEAYYGADGPLVWIGEDGIGEKAQAAMAALEEAGAFGLDPADYAVRAPVLDGLDDATRQRALMAFEVELSARVLAYVEDARRGRIDPNRISGFHDFKRKTVNLAPVLKMLKASPDVAAYLTSRHPSNAHFNALKAELAKLRAEDGDGHRIAVEIDGLLKPGASHAELANVVAAIEHKGSQALRDTHAATLAAYAQTPEYTPELADLVRDFQKEAGLKPDGIIGRATVRALTGDSNAEKIGKLVVAMEQSRWLPEDLGSRYVFINQPAYAASYFEGGREQFSMRVVVGSKTNQTYFFEDEIETVEVNPYWGVPQSIIVNEMLPKLRADPSYLDRLGYEVFTGGRKVASASVDWYGPVRGVSVRQPPTSDNALGELKILFPNSHAIYMHDTPAKSYFSRDMRALSHGCVRLAEPRRMAAAVLGVSEAEIGAQIAGGKNKAMRLQEKIPVYVSYFTAWPDRDGAVQYFDDVYERDLHVEKAFAATAKARASS